MKPGLNIEIKTISHHRQRYNTAGDYYVLGKKEIYRVSNMKDWRYERLVAIHELIESTLCKWKGITDAEIDAFDMRYPDNDDPGKMEAAPYHRQHMLALRVERMLAREMGVDWKKYQASFDDL